MLDCKWSRFKISPIKTTYIKKNKLVLFNKKGAKIIARQQLNKTYFRNGICYAVKRNTILKDKNLLGKNARALVLKKSVVNIDSFNDLRIARELF